MVFGLPLDILESTFFKTLIGNVDIHPTDVAVHGAVSSFNPGYTNMDGVQVFCTTPGNASTCRQVNAPSPKRAPQQTVTVNSPSPAPIVNTVTTVPSTMGTQHSLPEAVTGHDDNPFNLVPKPLLTPSARTFDNRTYSSNPFAFLFR
jgi:hypothetical protein